VQKNSSHNFPASQIWGKLQERVYRSRIHEVDQLNSRLIEELEHFHQVFIDEVILQWCPRLPACIRAQGGRALLTFIKIYSDLTLVMFDICIQMFNSILSLAEYCFTKMRSQHSPVCTQFIQENRTVAKTRATVQRNRI